jgi:hypothetical protein
MLVIKSRILPRKLEKSETKLQNFLENWRNPELSHRTLPRELEKS